MFNEKDVFERGILFCFGKHAINKVLLFGKLFELCDCLTY